MKIAIVGSGQVGRHFATALTHAGHEVMISSRTPQADELQDFIKTLNGRGLAGTLAETLAFSDVVALAMPWSAIPDVIASVTGWDSKLIIDMTNRFGSATSPAKDLAGLTGGRVVKAFNTIGAEHYPDPVFGGEPASMLIAGDDSADKALVSQLAQDLGFDVIDAGNLDTAIHLENLAAVWVHLAYRTAQGRDIAFRVIRD